MQVLADASRAHYQALVLESPGFAEYYRLATPADVIEGMRRGTSAEASLAGGLLAAAGTAAPAFTGINPENYETVVAYEKRAMSPDSAVAQLAASFAFMKSAMQAQTAATMTESKKMFGSDYTGQQTWIMATTHLHEHLGQMIAYARANNITPPWSK